MLRKIRIILAAVFLIGITLLFVGIGQNWWGWMAKLQLLPAVVRVIGGATIGNVAVLAAIAAVTLVFGRIYCSVICPLGIFQDLVIFLRNKTGRRKSALRFKYVRERKWLRYGILVLTVVAGAAGLQTAVAVIAPYSAYGRMVAALAGCIGGSTPVTALLVTAAATFILIGACAWIWGRAWCNDICPVGTLLGTISRHSLLRIRIDESKCKGCGVCGRKCKASCIDMDAHEVDGSRCIGCFDCIGNCNSGAIRFGLAGKADPEPAAGYGKTDSGKRHFIGTVALLAGSAISSRAQEKKLDGGLAPIVPKQKSELALRQVPPGSESLRNFYSRCTGCQLCVQACPNGVLRASGDLEHLLQPVMGFDKGFCRPECTACGDVCPTGAILPLTREAKSAVKTGTAAVNAGMCLAAKGEEECGNCSRHCPTGAITMIKTTDGKRKRPVVAEEICIGCGACEYLCPVRPVSAITVNGIEIHRNN